MPALATKAGRRGTRPVAMTTAVRATVVRRRAPEPVPVREEPQAVANRMTAAGIRRLVRPAADATMRAGPAVRSRAQAAKGKALEQEVKAKCRIAEHGGYQSHFGILTGAQQRAGVIRFAPGVNSPGVVQGLLQRCWTKREALLLATMMSRSCTDRNSSRNGSAILRSECDRGKELVLWNDGEGNTSIAGDQRRRWSASAGYTNVSYGGPGGGGCAACEQRFQKALATIREFRSESQTLAVRKSVSRVRWGAIVLSGRRRANALQGDRERAKVRRIRLGGMALGERVAESLGIITPIERPGPFPSLRTTSTSPAAEIRSRYDAGARRPSACRGITILGLRERRLAVDLGSWHVPFRSITSRRPVTTRALNVLTAPTVGLERIPPDFSLVDGEGVRGGDLHAERQKEARRFA